MHYCCIQTVPDQPFSSPFGCFIASYEIERFPRELRPFRANGNPLFTDQGGWPGGHRTGKLPSPVLIALSALANPAGGPCETRRSGAAPPGTANKRVPIKIGGARVAPQAVVSEEIQPTASVTPAITACPHACNFPVPRPAGPGCATSSLLTGRLLVCEGCSVADERIRLFRG